MKKWIVLILLVSLMLTACGQETQTQDEMDYAQAQLLLEKEDYTAAKEAFSALGDYRDSRYVLSEIEMAQTYEDALLLLEARDYPGAYAALCKLSGYKDTDAYLERFQAVEINIDNWAEYFEIVEIPTSTQNVAGEYEHLHITYVLQIKQAVWDRVYDYSANEVQIIIDYMQQMKNLVMDKETGEYTLVGFDDYISDMLQDRMLIVTFKEAEQQKEIEEAITVTGETIDGPYSFIDIMRDFSVREIEGKLYLYQ